tara:strand:+ start:2632 stop:3363 length:732 start_codon:yes stop_codon:yes gene_type:complete
VKYIILLLGFLLSVPSVADVKDIKKPVENVNSSMNSVEKKIRGAAVKVTKPFTGGHGSGSYIIYKDLNLIITAQHVTDGVLGTNYLVSHGSESRMATLIYSDAVDDIAVLYFSMEFFTIEPMKYNPLDNIAGIGTEIFYSGFPSSHKLMSFNGRVAGYENSGRIGDKHIILQTYGWFGCSGSVIYNLKGQIVGILYGVDVEYAPNVQVQENMIWVVPIEQLNIEKAIKPFCNGFKGKIPRACK